MQIHGDMKLKNISMKQNSFPSQNHFRVQHIINYRLFSHEKENKLIYRAHHAKKPVTYTLVCYSLKLRNIPKNRVNIE